MQMKSPKNDHNLRNLVMRYTNAQGKVIPMHHAFLTVHLSSFARLSAILLPPVFLLLIWLFLPSIINGWGSIFTFWMQRIYNGEIGYDTVYILGRNLEMPYPLLNAEVPSMHLVYMNLFVCCVAFLVSFVIPKRLAPVIYLVRAALLIQASASIDRMIAPEDFPYTLKIYITDSLSLAVYLVFLLPVVLGFVYYIFDFGFIRKIALTVIMLAYFFVTIPCQYMLHAYLIHEGTLLFLPIMYLLFGTLLDVLMFVSIYAFGMSWHSREQSMQGRGL